MPKPGRPTSESYQPVCYSGSQSLSFSSETSTVGHEDEDDGAPIFSLSKSSMDVVMATGPPHKRDPTWTRMDLRRSSSTHTPSEHGPAALKQRHPHVWQHFNASSSHQFSLTSQNVDVHSERHISSMQRWSQCSGSTYSRSSTDTIVWRDGTSRPSSLTQETPYSAAPDSPLSKETSPPPCRSSPSSPTLPPEELLAASSSEPMLSAGQQSESLASSPPPSPPSSPLQAQASSLSPPNALLQHAAAEDEGFLENNLLSFTFPSPLPSSVSLAEEGASSDGGGLPDQVVEAPHSPECTQPSEDGDEEEVPGCLMPTSTETETGAAARHLKLQWQLGQSCPISRSWRSPLVSSMSDSQLGECCRCNCNSREGATMRKVGGFREEATMTSELELVDAAVQTTSPIGSLWGLRRNLSTSNLGSHSILGSPPGSRLNLKSSVGSNSNLVSPSSSMFPLSTGDEEEAEEGEETQGDTVLFDSVYSLDLERKRSCLKIQVEDKEEMGRRSSMKQVQWDEDGMTWDVHGASLDPKALSTAIQKHLELQSSPQPARRASKKKKAPMPPGMSNVVKADAPELNPPVSASTSTCAVKGESEDTPDGGKEEVKEEEEGEEEGGKKKETAEARRISRAEGDAAKEEDEVYGEEGLPKSPSRGSRQIRKKSVIRLRRPGWCGGSRKPHD